MIYVELPYNESRGAPSRTIGVLWTPDLFCDGKYYFSDDNYRGVVGFLKAMTLLERFETLSGGTRTHDLHEAQPLLQKHLAGFVLITDMRSESFGERMPLHQWKMSGIAHVVNGTIMNGEFVDANACTIEGPSIRCLPSCYKIRLLRQNLIGHFWVTNRSFDFWSDDVSVTPSQTSANAKDRTFERTIAESHGEGTSSDSTTAESHGGASVASRPVDFVLQNDSPIAESHGEGTSSGSTTAESHSGGLVASRPAGFVLHDGSRPLASSDDDEVESKCMVCLWQPRTHVFEKCGHFGVCGDCWKWMCREQSTQNKTNSGKQFQEALAAVKAMKMNQLANVKIKCPYCRKVARALHLSKYAGATFRV